MLPPASVWTFRGGAVVDKRCYFDPREWEEQEALEPEAYYLQLRDTFSRTLPRYFDGRQRKAISLTGGLDSRMIMAWKALEPGTLPCYSFGDAARDCEDVSLARTVAAACGQPHEVIPVGNSFLSRFAHYAERSLYLSDACTGVDRAADLYLNERARTIAPVRLTGNYGGEVLRRVRAFKPSSPMPGLFDGGLAQHVRQAEQSYRELVQGHPLSFAVFRQAPWHHYGLLALEETQLSMRSPFLDNEFVRTVFRAPSSACQSNDVSLRLIADGNAALSRIRTDRGLAGPERGLLTTLQRRYLDFTFKAEYAYDSGMPQWLAGVDHVLSPLRLERLFLGRHKFAHFRIWYRDQLAGYVRDVLLDSRSLQRGYVNRKAVEETVAGHLKGNQNHTDAIHQMLTLELTHRLFFDAVPVADVSRASCA